MNLWISSIQSANLLSLKFFYIYITFYIADCEFRGQHSGLRYVIGDSSSSFKGFISWLSVENSASSSFPLNNPTYKISEGFFILTGAACNNLTCTWPWCLSSSNCFYGLTINV